MVSRSEPNSGSYQWDLRNFKDGAFELLKVFVKNHEGLIYGHDQSSYFIIDNLIEDTPFVKMLNEEFTTGRIFNQDTLTFKVLIGDSKPVPLTVRPSYSPDGGQQFNQFDSCTTMTDTMSSTRTIHLAPLGNSDIAVIKGEADNGKSTSSEQTFPFMKQTSTSVVERVCGKFPKMFTPEQDYPNPFNPSTKISFKLPASPAGGQASGFTTLKVYDVLGREVRTLVNEKLEAGSYETTFSAEGLTSGVYFYRLTVENFVDVKRMILLK